MARPNDPGRVANGVGAGIETRAGLLPDSRFPNPSSMAPASPHVKQSILLPNAPNIAPRRGDPAIASKHSYVSFRQLVYVVVLLVLLLQSLNGLAQNRRAQFPSMLCLRVLLR